MVREKTKHGSCKLYFTRVSNYVDVVCITCVFGLGFILSTKREPYPWLLNFVYIVVIIVWFQFCKELMLCLPFRSIGLNLNMWSSVAKSYVRIIACFAPFLLAMTYVFIGKMLWNILHDSVQNSSLTDFSNCKQAGTLRPWLLWRIG